MNMEDKKILLAALESLTKHIPSEKMGICGNLCRLCGEEVCFHDELCRHWRCWPKWSGSDMYPVPGDMLAYDFKPKWTGEYGALRRELLDFLIARVSADILAAENEFAQPPGSVQNTKHEAE